MNQHPGLDDGGVYLDYNATKPVDPRSSRRGERAGRVHRVGPVTQATQVRRPC